MKYLFVNVVAGSSSTGKIVAQQCRGLQEDGNECAIAYGRWQVNCEDLTTYRIDSTFECRLHGIMTRVFDLHGFCSSNATKRFLEWADKFNPDVLWLHNLHGYYLNVELLFSWIKSRPKMKVKWTLHDCWAFTGHCAYFTAVGCEQWKNKCNKCSQLRTYPSCMFKGSVSRNFERKRGAFLGVKDLTIITPSEWLADLTTQSFLRDYPIQVEYNKIDTDIFKPSKSTFRIKNNLQNVRIVLGVANEWSERKGLYDIYRLAQMLDDSYVIVVVGISPKQVKEFKKNIKGIEHEIDNAQMQSFVKLKKAEAQIESARHEQEIKVSNKDAVIKQDVYEMYKEITGQEFTDKISGVMRCSKIIFIYRTDSQKSLAELYSEADVFVNPTYEDNYPTVNLEAKACGTRVITYDTGGCRETLHSGGNL